jgi:hypothetical protein
MQLAHDSLTNDGRCGFQAYRELSTSPGYRLSTRSSSSAVIGMHGPLAPFFLGARDELGAEAEVHPSLPVRRVDRAFWALDLHRDAAYSAGRAGIAR